MDLTAMVNTSTEEIPDPSLIRGFQFLYFVNAECEFCMVSKARLSRQEQGVKMQQ